VSRSSRCTVVGFYDEIEPKLGGSASVQTGASSQMMRYASEMTMFPGYEQRQPTGHPELEEVELANHERRFHRA
jgi:hypothetical protein